MSDLRVGVVGAAGRMGRTVVRLVTEARDLTLGGAVDGSSSSLLGADAGELAGVGHVGVALGDDVVALAGACDVLVDFSTPEATAAVAGAAQSRGVALVVGTTGLASSARALAALEEASAHAPLLVAANFSVGVAVLTHLAAEATRLLGESFEVDIVEMHHSQKRDAPSGTAMSLASALADARKESGAEPTLVFGRHGTGLTRAPSEIGVLALRGGDVIGDHTVVLAGAGERLELAHRATTRDLFARGALRAAAWLHGRAPGRYTMRDVLGLG